jgi:hypothetical protein
MAYQQRKFRAAQQKPQGNAAAPRIKKIGIDDLSDDLRSEVGEAMQSVIEQAQATVAALQANVGEALRPLSESPILNGRVIRSVQIGNNAQGVRIAHGLGRPWLGYVVINTRNGGSGPVLSLPNKNPDNEIVLRVASGNALVDLYVF